MTQGMETFLNLPALDDALREKGLLPEENTADRSDDGTDDPVLINTVAMAQAAEQRLVMVEGRDHAEAMDKLFKETLQHAHDIMDLGFNVDPARSARMFEVATAMYGRAIEAKNSKRDAQLKAMKLALDQRRLDLDEERLRHQRGEADPIDAPSSVIVEDRNELIRRMREQIKKEQ